MLRRRISTWCSFIHLGVVAVAALSCSVSVPHSAWSQEKSGLDLLDEATDMKLELSQQRYSVRDLDRVITLCEAAIEAGLEEGNEAYAKQLVSATLYEQAQMVIDPVLEGRFDSSWRNRRALALGAIEKALEYTPSDGEAQLLLARIQGLPGGDNESGLAAGNRAVELLEGNPARKAMALLARAALQESNEKRLADYDAAVEIGADNLEAYRERGRARLIAGDSEAAVADFRHVLEENEEDIATIGLLTQALVAQDKFDEAIEQVTRLIDADPENNTGLVLRASLYVSQNEFEKAIGDLNACLRNDPTDLDALLGRAALREATGDFEEALADAGRALELRPGLPRALLLRSQIAASSGDFQQSIRDLRLLSRRDPENRGYKMQLASAYLANEQPQKSISAYSELIELDPEFWPAVRGRGDAYLGVGKHAEAIADYHRALENLAEESGLLNNLAWVLATSPEDSVRDGEEALELAKKACEVTEYQESHILSTLAATYAELGQFDEAIKWSTKAVEMEEGELKEQLTAELESYQAGKPWREKQVAEEDSAGVAPDDLFIDEVDNAESAQTEPAVPDDP